MSRTKEIRFEIEGIPTVVSFGHHTLNERCLERDISEYSIAGLIMALGEELLDLSMSESKEFGIVDVQAGESAICAMSSLDGEIWIDVITVVDTRNLYVKNGARVIKLEKALTEDIKENSIYSK